MTTDSQVNALCRSEPTFNISRIRRFITHDDSSLYQVWVMHILLAAVHKHVTINIYDFCVVMCWLGEGTVLYTILLIIICFALEPCQLRLT